jgi:hypothetical protein
MRSHRTLAILVGAIALGGMVSGQAPRTLTLFISAVDETGAPVTDLRPEEVIVFENGVPQRVVRVERQPVPLKITIAVDNSADSAGALSHYRAGLTGLVEALPSDIDVTLITTAAQPRTVLRPTADRTEIRRVINGFAPEPGRPRFSDALIEFSKRLENEAKDRRIGPYVPVVILISTTAVEQTSYHGTELAKAANFLVSRRARVNVVVLSTRTGQATSPETIDTSLQAVIGIPIAKTTNGRYESLSVSSRLSALLPEWGRELAALHTRQVNQLRVTVERSSRGELQDTRVELEREGLDGVVTTDGYLP